MDMDMDLQAFLEGEALSPGLSPETVRGHRAVAQRARCGRLVQNI